MGASHTTHRRLAAPVALALALMCVGPPSPVTRAEAAAPVSGPVGVQAPVAPKAVPEASVTVVPPAPAVHVVAAGSPAGAPVRTDIADVLLQAYRSAVAGSPPACHLRVSLLAAIGEVESGSLVGRLLDRQHRTAVLGPVLDGHGFAAVRDTDNGRWDGDKRWDRAVGPMQFLPGTWRAFGVDGDGDGVADPQDVEDATAGTAAYLCSHDRDLDEPAALRRAVLAYNHSGAYLRLVTAYAQRFAAFGLDDEDTTGLPTRLSLVASALPTAVQEAKGVKEARPRTRTPAKRPATTRPSEAPAALDATTPATSPDVSPDVPAEVSAAAPAAAPTLPAAPAPSAAAPAPTTAPTQAAAPAEPGTPAATPEACPTAPVDAPPSATDEPATPETTPAVPPETAAEVPPTDATEQAPAEPGDEVGSEPCAPCPDGAEPTPELPCQPVAVPTEAAPSSVP